MTFFYSSYILLQPLIFIPRHKTTLDKGYIPQYSLQLAVNPPVDLETAHHTKVMWEFKLNYITYNLPKGSLVEIGHPKIS